jgi:gliding motility-associated-like protein
MHLKYIIPLLLVSLLTFGQYAQAQLVVNEFSQGASGNKEYIEFVVKGQRTCSNNCADLRGWIFDDNNGWYGSTAISPGCYRFKNDPNWSCVPFGSIIVVYNSDDVNASLPPDDPTDANNDHVYVLPINSPYLEMNGSLPSSSSMTYPSTGFGAATTWTNMALNNTNDAVQTIDPTNLTASYHAVSYGSGVVSPVHISASGSQKVYYLMDAQYNTSTSWTSGSVPTNETPGVANTAANATWINGMLNGTGGGASSNDTVAVSICQGSNYTFNGNLYNASGYVTDTFVSSSGCDSIVTLNLVVHPIPAAPTVVSPLVYCQDIAATALSATGTNLLWYDVPTGGTGVVTIPVPSTNVAGTQMYYVTQTVLGCESPRASITIKTNPKPLPPVVTDSAILICQGTPSLTLSAQGQGVLWYNQPATGIGIPTAPVINTGIGHTETWYATQAVNGCESDRTAITVRVSGIHAAFSLSADTLCISDSLLANNLSIGNDSLNHWTFGDGFGSDNINQSHLYTIPGIYSVVLAIANTDGCRDTAAKPVWVSPVPDLKVTFDRYQICTGEHVDVNMKYLAGFSLLHWDYGDGNGSMLDDRGNTTARGTATQTDIQHAYDHAGMFFFSTTAYTPGCGTKYGSDSITVFSLPVVDLGPDTALCLHGNPIPLKNIAAVEDNVKYLWSTGETTPEITARHPGDISLTITTQYCANTGVVHIAKDCYIDVPNAFTPNGDGENDYFFPRQLLSSSVANFQMQIVNRWGQLIFETLQPEGRGWDGKFNGVNQPTGVYIYLIKVSFTNGASESYQGNVTLIR